MLYADYKIIFTMILCSLYKKLNNIFVYVTFNVSVLKTQWICNRSILSVGAYKILVTKKLHAESEKQFY